MIPAIIAAISTQTKYYQGKRLFEALPLFLCWGITVNDGKNGG